MKKILFSLVALVASMSMNAQVVKLMKGETVVAEYKASEVDNVVFEEAPAHEYVEIFADYDNNPSTPATSLKWAKKNLGAATEQDGGDYFAWGETTPRYTSYTRNGFNISFNWKSEYTSGGYETPYAEYSGATLDAAHDAATANWGGTWRTPTQAEFQAMYNATTWTWDSTDKGYYVTAKDVTLVGDKSNALLFLPAAGCVHGLGSVDGGKFGVYWSSSLYTGNSAKGYALGFSSSDINLSGNDFRYYGFTVRPVSD